MMAPAPDRTDDLPPGVGPLPASVLTLVADVATQLGPALRSLALFGSRIPSRTPDTQPHGVPDLLALIDDHAQDDVLRALGCPARARRLAAHLPPLTWAYSPRGPVQAKLNIVGARVAAAQIGASRDLYLTGRISKLLLICYTRDAACRAELTALSQQAAQQMARWVVLGLPPRSTLTGAVRACIALSYRAELRPEGARKLHQIYDRFADFYDAHFGPHLLAAAMENGFAYEPTQGLLLHPSTPAHAPQRVRARAALGWLLMRSRLRSALRWPKQMIVYRGWFSYVRDKWRRARRCEINRA